MAETFEWLSVRAKMLSLVERVLNMSMSVSWEGLPTQVIFVGSSSFVAVDSGRAIDFRERRVVERISVCVTFSWPVVVLLSYEKAPSSALVTECTERNFSFSLVCRSE